jgi:hypothetical protein
MLVLRSAYRTHSPTTRPPDVVSELPEWVDMDKDCDGVTVHLKSGVLFIEADIAPDDLSRLSEVYRILAARRRAQIVVAERPGVAGVLHER